MTRIRSATATDIPEILTLNAVVQTWHATTYPTRFKADPDRDHVAAMFRDIITDDDAYLWVAEAEKGLNGYLFASHILRPETPISHAARRLHIEHICVAQDVRRSGIGAALIATAETTARSLGADELTLDTWAANTAAQATFRASGLSPARLWFAKPL